MIQHIAAERGSLFRAAGPLVLASASPRRRDFLASLGLDFSVCPGSDAAEPHPRKGEAPEEYARRACLAKTRHVAARLAGSPELAGATVIGADTVVALEGTILGKPRHEAMALDFLRRLAGKEHLVVTACALLPPGGGEELFSVRSAVRMWKAPDAVLRGYCRSGEPLDKAGGYAVQGAGAFLVESISGSWSSVVGLPLAELVAALLRRGLIAAA
jgi:septum formation protein